MVPGDVEPTTDVIIAQVPAITPWDLLIGFPRMGWNPTAVALRTERQRGMDPQVGYKP